MGQHIIFEGAELAGKSYLMSQVYNFLEPKYNSGGPRLDGCHWFNLDVGLYGGSSGSILLDKFTELMENLPQANILLEKFHLSQATYENIFVRRDFDFSQWEKRLAVLATKIILVTFKEDQDLIKHRLADRLKLYPHYRRIARPPQEYIQQQKVMIDLAGQSILPVHIVDASVLPDDALIEDILKFLGEK